MLEKLHYPFSQSWGFFFLGRRWGFTLWIHLAGNGRCSVEAKQTVLAGTLSGILGTQKDTNEAVYLYLVNVSSFVKPRQKSSPHPAPSKSWCHVRADCWYPVFIKTRFAVIFIFRSSQRGSGKVNMTNTAMSYLPKQVDFSWYILLYKC